jgi:uncharacterized membrane protein YhaH (DUF805 family)
MTPPADIWYFFKDGKQYGPLTMEELRFISENGELNPRQDLVWSPDSAEWRPAGEISGLFPKAEVPSSDGDSLSVSPDFTVPAPPTSRKELMAGYADWPGAGRAMYIAGTAILYAVVHFGAEYVRPYLLPVVRDQEYLLIAFPAIIVLCIISLATKRLQNVGMSGLWCLGHLVPILNLWVGYRSWACPAGYAYHRKFDGIGIFLAAVYWLVVLGSIALIALGALVFLGHMGDPAQQQQMQELMRQVEEVRKQTPKTAGTLTTG